MSYQTKAWVPAKPNLLVWQQQKSYDYLFVRRSSFIMINKHLFSFNIRIQNPLREDDFKSPHVLLGLFTNSVCVKVLQKHKYCNCIKIVITIKSCQQNEKFN